MPLLKHAYDENSNIGGEPNDAENWKNNNKKDDEFFKNMNEGS